MIIDDEVPAIRLMEKYISQASGLRLIESYRSPVKALDGIMEQLPDLLFCDIQMPGMTGIELSRKLTQKTMIIFTTAYSEFAAEAFDIDAIDYLRKPFSFERFSKAVDKARENVQLKTMSGFEEVKKGETDYIIVKADYKLVKVYFDEILFIEAFQEYVKIITDKNRFITFERMKNMENLLPSDKFIRIHRSYIVAKHKVKSFSGNLLELGDHQLPVSRDLKEKVLRFLFS
jgi:DNA-binding LytR/AlgR family response regulator